jgi:hypothetical protein
VVYIHQEVAEVDIHQEVAEARSYQAAEADSHPAVGSWQAAEADSHQAAEAGSSQVAAEVGSR